MENFQLYRTNLQLSGQLKYDIIIDNVDSSLVVSDFHLRPISDNIPYTYKTVENLLNNSNQDNIKSYYKSIQGNFYNEGLNPMFKHNWPVICNESEIINAYSNIYDMGCKRMKSYSLYNRQFEFFCPLWIEKVENDITFKFNVKIKGTDIIITSKSLCLKHNENKFKTHNKFVSYLNDYFKYLNLNSGDDNILNIDFSRNKTSVSGLNIQSGLVVTKNVIGFTSDLKNIERPMMETDNMLMSLFSGNNIIAKQLFNFNLCFNLSDIMTDTLFEMINGEDLTVELEVYIGAEKLEKRDFYTNYEFIDRSVKNENLEETYNVFDYLQDNKAIDLIDKNKFCQSICHWSLAEDNDYIFNLYDGFSGLYIEKNSDYESEYFYHENEHQYRDFPNLYCGHADIATNSTGWINIEKIEYWNNFYKYISNTEKYQTNGNYINGNIFINNVKYHNIPSAKKYIIGLLCSRSFLNTIKSNVDTIDITTDLILVIKGDLIMIISSDINNFAYKNISTLIIDRKIYLKGQLNGDKQVFYEILISIMENVIRPDVIMLNKSLKHTVVSGPSHEVKEIEYVDINDSKYVCRYSGKLKPTFISNNLNELYFKDYVSNGNESNLSSSKYIKYLNSGFEPKYPSINYFSIEKIDNWNYDKLPEITSSEGKGNLLKNTEYSWFNDNSCLILHDTLHFKKKSEKTENGYKSLNDLLRECISEQYKSDDKNRIDYIISKYNITSNWEYAAIDNVDDYVYDITLKLK